MKVAIIGGTRGLGFWIAKFLKSEGLEVTITSQNEVEGLKIAKNIGVKYSSNNIETAMSNEIVIVSVPISVTPEVIREVAPHLTKGSLLMDVTSVKELPSKIMAENIADGAYFLPVHPMFGPRITSLEGQVVVLTPHEKHDWFNRVLKFLKSRKTRVLITEAHIHDEMMSVVQGLTHFAYVNLAYSIKKLGTDIRRSRDFASPIYNLMLDIVARIVSQNPSLIYSIQSQTDYAFKSRDVFLECATELSEIIAKGDYDLFNTIIRDSRKNFSDIDSALGRSDKAISSITNEFHILKENIGLEVGLKHIYSGKTHIGILKELNPDHLILDTGRNDISLNLSNIEILSKENIWDWKVENLHHYKFDVSGVFPDTCNPKLIADTVCKMDGVINASLVDVYSGTQINADEVSVTVSFEVLDEKLRDEVERFFKGFGAKIR